MNAKFLTTSLALGLSVTVIAACDGRGVTAFKAKTAVGGSKTTGGAPGGTNSGGDTRTMEERNAAQVPRNQVRPILAPPADLTDSGSGASANNTASANRTASSGPQSKSFDVTVRKAMKENVESKLNEANASANLLVPAITFSALHGLSAQVGHNSALLSFEAAIRIRGQDHDLFVNGVEVSFDEAGKVEGRRVLEEGLLRRADGLEADRKLSEVQDVFVGALCVEKDCKTLYVQIEFPELVSAVFALEAQGAMYKVVASNLTMPLKDFSKFQDERAKSSLEQQKAAKAAADRAAADKSAVDSTAGNKTAAENNNSSGEQTINKSNKADSAGGEAQAQSANAGSETAAGGQKNQADALRAQHDWNHRPGTVNSADSSAKPAHGGAAQETQKSDATQNSDSTKPATTQTHTQTQSTGPVWTQSTQSAAAHNAISTVDTVRNSNAAQTRRIFDLTQEATRSQAAGTQTAFQIKGRDESNQKSVMFQPQSNTAIANAKAQPSKLVEIYRDMGRNASLKLESKDESNKKSALFQNGNMNAGKVDRSKEDRR
jgi:hypothetical protein